MTGAFAPSLDIAQAARAGRAQLEAVLDELGWPWLPGVSGQIDRLVVVEEETAL